MTATTAVETASPRARVDLQPAVTPRRSTSSGRSDAVPPLSPKLQVLRAALVVLFVLSASLVLQLVFVSDLQHRTSQQEAYSDFRTKLAEGTAPTGPVDFENRVLDPGAPVAYLQIPTIDLDEVVGQGTAASQLFDGPGHRRDTVLPGQIGTSILMGRRATYGAPFADIGELVSGDLITVTTAQGVFEYRVIGVRREGDPLPPPLPSGSSRLVLATADGRALLPSGVLRVDADIVSVPQVGQPRLVTDRTLPDAEQLMGIDTTTLWVLVLWLQALLLVSVATVWAWHRWGRVQAWVAGVPPLAFVGLGAAGEIARLLPNLT